MARGQQQQATKTYNAAQGQLGTENNLFGAEQGNANALYSKLFPTLSAEATNPQGYGPTDLAAMNTASQQSVGGSTAGAVGEGNLTAARTRNSGGFAPALDESVRSGQRQLSENAVGIQGENAKLKQAQQQAGISGLTGLYGTNSDAMLKALGLGNQSLEVENQATGVGTQAGNSGWFQNFLNTLQALKPGGSTSGGGSLSFGGAPA